MVDQRDGTGGLNTAYDGVAEQLQALRFSAGDVPYAEIVRRIGVHRALNGGLGAATRPARTTVYDAFRPGRARVNPALVGEIARALGASEEEVAGWETRCLDVRRRCDQEASVSHERQVPVAPTPATSGKEQLAAALQAPTARRPALLPAVILMLVCIGSNVLGFSTVHWLGLPLYLDMVGTAMAAVVLGPWWGVLVGVSTNVIGLTVTDESSLVFILVQVVGALIWGYGARKIRRSHSVAGFFALSAVVAISCTGVSTVLLVTVFGGGLGHGSEVTMDNLMNMGESLTMAVFTANLLYSLVDKCLAGFVVLAVLGSLRQAFPTAIPALPSGLSSAVSRWAPPRESLATEQPGRDGTPVPTIAR